MRTYTTADGKKHPYLTFMDLPPLKPGYLWQNVAPLGHLPEWAERPVTPPQDDGKLFGYPVAVFMGRQYKYR